MSKIAFILPYMVFMFFVIFASVEWQTANAYNPDIVNYGNISHGSNITQGAVISGNVRPPTCEIEGWDAILDLGGCATNYLGFFIGMAFISSDFLLLNILIFLPLGIAFIWIIFEMIRGV